MPVTGMKTRTAAATACRTVLTALGLTEIIPLLMAEAVPIEPTIYPFAVDGKYLATSPEAALKQAMAAGAGNCFAIEPVFRNLEGTGRWHQPEFLMAEWYQQDTNWLRQMALTQQVVTEIYTQLKRQRETAVVISAAQSWPQVSLVELWLKYLETDLLALVGEAAMVEYARKLGYTTTDATWEQLFNQIVFNTIEPHYPKTPFFLTDFPARISPLAKPQPENPALAERFELIIEGVELANGNTERFDEAAIRQLMAEEQRTYQPGRPVPQNFLTALKQLSGQQWAGVGLGLDRLAAFLTGTSVQEIQNPSVDS